MKSRKRLIYLLDQITFISCYWHVKVLNIITAVTPWTRIHTCLHLYFGSLFFHSSAVPNFLWPVLLSLVRNFIPTSYTCFCLNSIGVWEHFQFLKHRELIEPSLYVVCLFLCFVLFHFALVLLKNVGEIFNFFQGQNASGYGPGRDWSKTGFIIKKLLRWYESLPNIPLMTTFTCTLGFTVFCLMGGIMSPESRKHPRNIANTCQSWN